MFQLCLKGRYVVNLRALKPAVYVIVGCVKSLSSVHFEELIDIAFQTYASLEMLRSIPRLVSQFFAV